MLIWRRDRVKVLLIYVNAIYRIFNNKFYIFYTKDCKIILYYVDIYVIIKMYNYMLRRDICVV